jgi:ABC-type transport system involved in multi-copper enzyme maturation permease subunit
MTTSAPRSTSTPTGPSSSTGTTQELRRLDASGTPPQGFPHLVLVELRKAVDTRAGRWLLVAILALTAAAIGLVLAVGDESQHTMPDLLSYAATPQSFLLPVLGILLVTSEWTQRTALVTFALTSSRSLVVSAKIVAALLLALAAVVGAVIVAAAATVAGGNGEGFAEVTVATYLLFAALQLLNVLMGVAFGLLLLNTPAAISIFFILPVVSSLVFTTVPALEDLAPWLDLQTAQSPLTNGDFSLTGEQLAQSAVAALIWIALPLVAGWYRTTRAEVK